MGAATFVSKRQKGYLWRNKRPVYLKFMAQRGGLDLSSLPWYVTKNLRLSNAPGATAAGRWSKKDLKIYDRVVGLYNKGFISARKFTGAKEVFRARARARALGKKPGKLQLELWRKAGRKKGSGGRPKRGGGGRRKKGGLPKLLQGQGARIKSLLAPLFKGGSRKGPVGPKSAGTKRDAKGRFVKAGR